jgi:predicted nuclease of predicted toxin-antitoxin system
MKFLIDAQLPKRLANLLQEKGYDAIHTSSLEMKNRTLDKEINLISIEQKRIVITKDSDFLESFLIKRQPYKLLLVTTGNITNRELETVFLSILDQLSDLFDRYFYIELSRNDIIVHQ